MSSGGHGQGRRRPRGGGHDEEHENTERWLVSYSDMITVLMALFIVLFAISQVDQSKYISLRDSLAAGFGSPITTVVSGGQGALTGGTSPKPAAVNLAGDAGITATAGPSTTDTSVGASSAGASSAGASSSSSSSAGVDPKTLAAAQAEANHLEAIEAEIKAKLDALGLSDRVRFTINKRGLIIGLVADDVFFANGSADLTDTARQVLDGAGPALAALTEQISVEGHANVLPVSGRYPTNWELSADRATQVLRRLVEADHVAPDRIMAVGFGDARPLVAGTSPEALMVDRRVDLVVLSSAPEQVRALVPTLVPAADQSTVGG
ncbi:chemotaxis protein LafU [mine drainage metagenome]|uniref:Chemotaxis protein LafU n=1 Tax=mine drainage metagenome TaxID=410659 RepID=A0A1J5QUN3_9ZZZZ